MAAPAPSRTPPATTNPINTPRDIPRRTLALPIADVAADPDTAVSVQFVFSVRVSCLGGEKQGRLLRGDGDLGLALGIDEGRAVDGDDDPVEAAGEREGGPVLLDNGETPVVAAGQAAAVQREPRGREAGDLPLADDGAVDQEAAHSLVLAGLREAEGEAVAAGGHRRLGRHAVLLPAGV